jgi:CRISPR-associated protein (TIGR03984 family)
MTPPTGYEVARLDHTASLAWLDFVLGRGEAPAPLDGGHFLLCHCDDGVTWGRLEDGTWRLGSAVFSDLCPVPSEVSLQEMRVFSRDAEVLLWRVDAGLRGRVLRDSTRPISDGPLVPYDEAHLLLGGRVVEYRDGFTRVCDGTGAEQALPLRVVEHASTSWLYVRHYFALDRYGCARVVATRLMEVK